LQVAQIPSNTVVRPISVQRRFSFPSRRLVLLAPSNASIPKIFHDAYASHEDHRSLLSEIQRFRGRVYLADGAIEESDLTDGRHVTAADEHSWHFIVHDANGDIAGCIRYQAHDLSSLLLRLSVFNSSLAACPEWGPTLRRAVESEIALAKTRQLTFVEVGGWAVAEHVRNTAEPLRLGLVAYSLGRLMGGAVGLCTATRRHCSSSILRRIGGRFLEHEGTAIPTYYDPRYACEMDILRFHSWNPNPRYELWIEEIRKSLQCLTVIRDSSREFLAAACAS
jgi:hypothetical protein